MRWILITFLATTAFAAEKSLEEHWRDTGLSFSAVEPSFTEKECYAAERSFLACVMALDAAVPTPKVQLVTKERFDQELGQGRLVASFGNLVAIEPPVRQTSGAADRYKTVKEERTRNQRAWSRLYQNRSVAGVVNFAEIIQWIKSEPDFAKDEAVLTARAFNTLLAVEQDPHTAVLPISYVRQEASGSGSNFSGIGARMKAVEINGTKTIVVESPLENSPALKAGLRAHDVVTHIDTTDIAGWELAEAVKLIRGPKGTPVVLTVDRKGQSLDISITRDDIVIPNVSYRLVTSSTGTRLGYVRLTGFMKADGCRELGTAVTAVLKQGAKGLLFDLRDNGGGLLTQGVCVANLFLPKGRVVVSTKSLSGQTQETLRTEELPLTNVPMATLVNAYSASASEIVAGALQDHARSFIVGVRSYGKGSVQTQRPLNQALAIRVTTARFYLPSGRTNQIEGILPDFEAYNSPAPTEDDKVAYREEDEYLALPALGTPWVQPRPKVIAAIDGCRTQKGNADAVYQRELAQAAMLPDYQRLVAEDVLDCALSLPQPPTSSGFEIGNARQYLLPALKFDFNFDPRPVVRWF